MLFKLNFRILFLFSALFFLGCQGTRPLNLGINKDGKLQPCPDSPNCVVSDHKDKSQDHHIEPILIHSNQEIAHKKLKSIVETSSGAKLIKNEKNYLYAEFTSSIIKFVDDVEFLFSKDGKSIAIRSASRKGRSDFGVNRKRIETIRFRFQQNDYKK